MARRDPVVWLVRLKDNQGGYREHLSIRWKVPGTRKVKTESTGTSDPDKAERIRADREYELRHGTYAEPSAMPWERFADMTIEERFGGSRRATRTKARTVFGRFARLAKPLTLADVDARMLSRHAAQLRVAGKSVATIHSHLAYLKTALNWAARQGLIARAPAVDMPKLPTKIHIRTITLEDLERIMAVAPARWTPFLWTAWHTGMRRNELTVLDWDEDSGKPWVDLQRKKIWLPAAFTKSDADQWLPMHPDLVKLLLPLRRVDGRVFAVPNSLNEVSRYFVMYAKKAGVKCKLHDIRRSFGTRYAPHVPAHVLQRLMRHSDIKTTMRYYANLDGALDDAILKGDPPKRRKAG